MQFSHLVISLLTIHLTGQSLCLDSRHCSNKFPCLLFEDNFDWFNLDNWEHEITASGGGNGEFQYYLNNRTNSYVKDGILHIKPTFSEDRFGKDWPYWGTLDLWGTQPADVCTGNGWEGCHRQASGEDIVHPIQSARIRTAKSFSFRYGRMEIEAKLGKGDWIWPALWLHSKRQKYGIFPASGEIDLMESRGNADLIDHDGVQIGTPSMWVALHFGPYRHENAFMDTLTYKTLKNGRTFADDFHRFRLDWDENGKTFFVDDEQIAKFDTPKDGYWKRGGWADRMGPEVNPWTMGNKDAPFDQEYYIVMNAAVGGTVGYFGEHGHHPSYPKPWENQSPIAMRQFWQSRNLWGPTWPNDDSRALQVNYVRVWKLKEDCWLTKPPTCTP